MPDPKLKQAAEEIKAILKRHDITATVCLQSQGHLEFLRVLEATWSCARLEPTPDGGEIRIRAKRADFESADAQKQMVSDTAGMVFGFHHHAEQEAAIFARLLALLSQTVGMRNILRTDE